MINDTTLIFDILFGMRAELSLVSVIPSFREMFRKILFDSLEISDVLESLEEIDFSLFLEGNPIICDKLEKDWAAVK